MDAARALDFSRRSAVGPAGRGHRAHLHRRRRGALAVGAAAVALSVDLGAGVPVAPAAAAQMDTLAAAAGNRGRGGSAGAVGSERNLLLTLGGHLLCFFVIAMACHGELAAHPAGDELAHRLLRGAVVRRHARRVVRGADRALHILVDCGISDPGGAGGIVPTSGGEALAELEPLVLAAARHISGAVDCTVLVRQRQPVCLAG